jgi:putative phosphoribosyl transferase
MTMKFTDRFDAGRKLTVKMMHYEKNPDAVILGLSRGGVVVAHEAAMVLGVPMDIFLVRKLGVPGREELAMGALASGDVTVLNHALIRQLDISDESVAATIDAETRELHRREELYRKGYPPLQLSGRISILMDDGLATGATMRVAIRAVRGLHAARVVVAVPVAAPESLEAVKREADETICLFAPLSFQAVGQWYEHFEQVTDDDVRDSLEHRKAA